MLRIKSLLLRLRVSPHPGESFSVATVDPRTEDRVGPEDMGQIRHPRPEGPTDDRGRQTRPRTVLPEKHKVVFTASTRCSTTTHAVYWSSRSSILPETDETSAVRAKDGTRPLEYHDRLHPPKRRGSRKLQGVRDPGRPTGPSDEEIRRDPGLDDPKRTHLGPTGTPRPLSRRHVPPRLETEDYWSPYLSQDRNQLLK